MFMIRSALAPLMTLLLITSAPALSQKAPLSQGTALQKAIAILKGDPYGETPAEVRSHIVGSAIAFPGSRTPAACGPTEKPLWIFDVSVPAKAGAVAREAINGALVLDAVSGKMECASLPFLD